MKTIWKFPLELTDDQIVMMPDEAEILTVQIQELSLCLWALVDPRLPMLRRKIEIIGTGNPAIDRERKYISTVQMADGALVWHFFEIP